MRYDSPKLIVGSVPGTTPPSQLWVKKKVNDEEMLFGPLFFFETFICFKEYLEQKPYGGKSVQKIFLHFFTDIPI